MTSSGAAIHGSPLSGGYGGAKKMIWLMAQYANSFSRKSGLNIRFQVIVPLQMVGGTGTGDVALPFLLPALEVFHEQDDGRFAARLGARYGGGMASARERA
jgi:hypothetical protein